MFVRKTKLDKGSIWCIFRTYQGVVLPVPGVFFAYLSNTQTYISTAMRSHPKSKQNVGASPFPFGFHETAKWYDKWISAGNDFTR